MKKLKISRIYTPGLILRYSSYFIIPAVITSILLYIFIPGNMSIESIEDENLKNKLLLSEQTDFNAPPSDNKLYIREHKVSKGETLGVLAKKFGVSVDTICGSNNLTSYDMVSVGTLLKIPSRDGLLYKTEKGTKLSALASKYKISVTKILDENEFKNADFIPLGTVLFIPDAKPQNIVQGFLWPVSNRTITCGFGWRRSPFNWNSVEFHQGLDIRANYESVRATRYGQITYAGWLGAYGNAVIVAHPGGWKSLYAHLSRIGVSQGQYVKQGQYLARSGNTGLSTGAHIHFEIIKNGSPKNPYSLLKRR
jgi:murein DD-endopeptidase MepM/ murein hydrolase activator NlpD